MTMAATPKRTRSTPAAAAGADTRDRLVEAARACLRAEGIAGVSARAIARYGDLNQALVFYHFGSVDGLLQAVARQDASRRAALYADRLGAVQTLKDLVAVGRRIHDVEFAEGSGVVLTQLLAGAASSPELGAAVQDGMTAWTSLIEDALARVLAGTPLGQAVPIGDIAYAIASLFLGLELVGGVDGDDHRVASLFGSLDAVTGLVDLLLRGTKA
jgi:AcrR family transcriptional regulator